METILDGTEMNPLLRLWLRMIGRKIPDIHAEVHRENQELSRLAHELKEQLERYKEAEDPFLAMIQDVWNRRQMRMPGNGPPSG